ncbi:MAG TPA: regulatory iron-sulfur-containing complex subunit RicT [Bacteroidia bacterium]|nr:regulatory iron-sulfur-containing complex subunit RicT [Bacteroidia bacterium]
MACNSCGTGTDGTPGGCRNNGTCGTGGCNKLNVYNWLTDMVLPHGQQPFDIVEVRFKGSRKEFFRNKEAIDLRAGDVVAVESSPGHDVGVVSMVGELVRFQLKKKNITEDSDVIKALYRKAKQNEVEKWLEVKDKEPSTLSRAREIIQSLKLSMKLGDVEYQGDGKKATFFYTADDRVDFRELIKRLADEFRIRVEMRQIGMRQEASRLGGLGVCGRELCCSTWLTDFKTVSTSTARYQNLALNPAKLAGQCGKLKCCLNYELDSYMDILKDFPSTNVVLETEGGRAYHRKTDIFKRLLWYAYSGDDKREQSEGSDGGDGGNWIALPVNRVNEIIELNKQKIRPAELRDASTEEEIAEKEPDYANVVGQDSIDRMDKKKKKKKKKKKPSAGTEGGRPPHLAASGESKSVAPQRPQQPARPQGQQEARPPRPQQQGGGNSQRNQLPRQQGQQPRPQTQGQQAKPQQQGGQQPRPERQQQNRQRQQRPPQNPPSENPSTGQTGTPAQPGSARGPRQRPGQSQGGTETPPKPQE